MGEKNNSHKYFFRKRKGKKQLVELEVNKSYLNVQKKKGKKVVDWLKLAWDKNQCWTVVRFVYCLSN
jgi:hypothetical protein